MGPDTRESAGALSAAEVAQFIRDGVIGIPDAFPRQVADRGRAILWRDTGCDPEDPTTWTRPVVRLGLYGQAPFVEAANTSTLRAAFDQLVGAGRWQPRQNLGTFPVRFPSREDPGDSGWHIDPGFDFEKPDFLDWRANIRSEGRALLMLFLFSDVGPNDAPTRIRVGSHLDIARRLAPAGERGLSLRELAANDFAESAGRPEIAATGEAGTVYLCHPFLVHAAQAHHGVRPRFMAQPPLLPASPSRLDSTAGPCPPVERAIELALENETKL